MPVLLLDFFARRDGFELSITAKTGLLISSL